MPAGKYIKIALIESGIQQKELAEKLGVTNGNISKMLKNDKIGYNKVEEIADILGYEIIWRKKENNNQSQTVNNSGYMEIGIQNNPK